jgi:hypothetical protein
VAILSLADLLELVPKEAAFDRLRRAEIIGRCGGVLIFGGADLGFDLVEAAALAFG